MPSQIIEGVTLLSTPVPTSWHVGFGRVEITPPAGVWLAGFGGRTRPADGVHDPLYATAAVFANDAGEYSCLISCDVLSIDAPDAEALQTRVHEATGIPSHNVLIHATHTHAGPHTSSMRGFGLRDQDYVAHLFDQVVKAATLAHADRKPARVTLDTVEVPFGINRRELKDGHIIIGENPAGAYDPRVLAIGVWPLAEPLRGPVGIVLWTAVHPVAYGGSNYLFGRDFPHFAITELEAAFPDVTCLYLTGPCGDINPRGMGAKDRFATARAHGVDLARAVLRVLASPSELAPGTLESVWSSVDVPLDPLPPKAQLEGWLRIAERETNSAEAVDAELHRHTHFRLQWLHDALAAHDPTAPGTKESASLRAKLHGLRFGEFWLIGMPFEVFVEYQAVVDQARGRQDSLIVGYAGGNFGYLPTRAAFDEGGYEVDRAWQLYTLQRFSRESPATVASALTALCRLMA